MSRVLMIIVVVLFGTAVLNGRYASPTVALQATPNLPASITITSEVLGSASPVPIAEPELTLGRVTVMPGAVLPVHYHPGSQVGVVVQGELTYTVLSGEVVWQRGDRPDSEPTIISPGKTVVVRPGDALIENPDAVHQGRNDGDVPLVIYLSSLFPTGAPRSVTVEGTPDP